MGGRSFVEMDGTLLKLANLFGSKKTFVRKIGSDLKAACKSRLRTCGAGKASKPI
jgi:hypothetical protein